MLSQQVPFEAPAALSYAAFLVSVLTPLVVGAAAWKRSHSRREQHASADKAEAEAGSISSGITLEGWRESRQEVHDARADAKEARHRAEKLSERLDACEAENRRLRVQLAEMQGEIDTLRNAPPPPFPTFPTPPLYRRPEDPNP